MCAKVLSTFSPAADACLSAALTMSRPFLLPGLRGGFNLSTDLRDWTSVRQLQGLRQTVNHLASPYDRCSIGRTI